MNILLGAPVVGTFHAYATKPMPNHIASLLGARRLFNQLTERIAVSEAAAWTGKRWFGGDYTIVPNGVDVSSAPTGPKPAADHLRLLFVGRAEERKGLPILLSAFEALVEHVPTRLTVVGADPEDVCGRIADPEPKTIALETYHDIKGPATSGLLGMNARSRATRLRKLGWQPVEKSWDRSFLEDELVAILQGK